MRKNEAIERFHTPDYECYGDDLHIRLFYFSGMIAWRELDRYKNHGAADQLGKWIILQDVSGLLFEVHDNGRVLQRCTPDAQVKYKMSLVDNILLGDNDES